MNREKQELIEKLTTKFGVTPKSEGTDIYLDYPNVYDLTDFILSLEKQSIEEIKWQDLPDDISRYYIKDLKDKINEVIKKVNK